MRWTRRRIPLCCLLLTALPAAARAAAASAAVAEEAAAVEATVRGLLPLRERESAGLPDPPRPSLATDGCYAIELVGAAPGGRLTLYLVWRDGGWLPGPLDHSRAAPGGWVVPVSLRSRGGRLAGDVDVHLRPLPLGADHPVPSPRTYRYELDLSVDHEGVRGRARLKSAARAERLPEPPPPPVDDVFTARELSCGGSWHPCLRPAFPPLAMDEAGAGLPRCYAAEHDAETILEQIRVLRMMRATGLPFDLAWRRILHVRTWREPPPEPGATAAPAGRDEEVGPPTLGGLDDDEDIDDLDLGALEAVDLAAPDIDPAFALPRVRSIRRHVEAIAAALRLGAKTSAKPPGGCAAELDPDFGPWSTVEALPADDDGTAHLSAPRTSDEQRWAYLPCWRVAGPIPFHAGSEPVPTPDLPSAVPAADAPPIDAAVGVGRAHPDRGAVHLPLPERDRLATAPVAKREGVDPESGCTYLATAELQVAEDCTVWAAAHVNDAAWLRVDGRLAWSSGQHGARNRTVTRIFRLELAAGRHRLHLRLDNRHRPARFGLLFALAGSPRPAPAWRADLAGRAQAAAALPAPDAGHVGWRHDANGRFPAGAPVTSWDRKAGLNVLWHRRLRLSSATPLVLGDRLICTQRPAGLLCLDKASGETIWEHDCDPLAVIDPETHAELAPAKERARRRYAELFALREQRLAARRAGDATAAEAAGQAARTLVLELQREARAFLPAYREHKLKPFDISGKGTVVDEMFATPVSDGERIWTVVQGRLLVCVDLDGTRRWAVDTPGRTTGKDCASLRLLGDTLVARLGLDKHTYAIGGWDATSGERRWLTRFPLRRGLGGSTTATPVALRLPTADGHRDVVMAANFHVVDARDGAVLLPNLGWLGHSYKGYGTPVVRDDTVYTTRGTSWVGEDRYELVAFRLWFAGGHLHARERWCREVPTSFYGGLVLAGDAVHLGHYGRSGNRLLRYAVDDGRELAPVPDLFPVGGTNTWSPPVHCPGDPGLLIYAESWGSGGRDSHPNHLAFVRTGDRPRVIARPELERALPSQDVMVASPVPDGRRLYLRSMHGLLAVGPTGADGSRHEAAVNARCALAAIPASAPLAAPPLRPETVTGKRAYGDDIETLVPGRMLRGWTTTGACPAAAAAELAREIGFPRGPIPQEFRVADAARSLTPLHQLQRAHAKGEALPAPGTVGLRFGGATGGLREGPGWPYGPRLDVLEAMGREAGTVSYWLVPFRNDWPRRLRLDLGTTRPVEAWIDHLAIEPGQAVDLAPGLHVLALAVRLDDPVPPRFTMIPRLLPATDADADAADRRQRIRADRDLLARAVELLPGTPLAARCRELLVELP